MNNLDFDEVKHHKNCTFQTTYLFGNPDGEEILPKELTGHVGEAKRSMVGETSHCSISKSGSYMMRICTDHDALDQSVSVRSNVICRSKHGGFAGDREDPSVIVGSDKLQQIRKSKETPINVTKVHVSC